MELKKLAIISTHPTQYYAPFFRFLTQRNKLQLKVFYTWGEQAQGKVFDPGFGKERDWDIPLLDGYDYEFVTNISTNPGSSHFKGIINPSIISRISIFKPDALLVFGWAFHSHLKMLRYFKGKIPVYFRGDSTLLDEPVGFSIKKMARRIFLKWVYSHIDKAFYVGTNNKAYYLLHGVPDYKLVYAPHAVDNKRFQKNDDEYKQQANKWRQQLHIPEGKLTVLFCGKLESKKNPFLIIQAAKKMSQMHFIIAGSGILEGAVKEAAAGLSNVTLLPFQNQSKMPLLYRMATVFILPSKGPAETWGLAINEAMACGRLVIASNKCGGAVDLIKQGTNGYIIDPDIGSFMQALQALANDKSILSNGSQASKQIIESFSYTKVAEAIEETLLSNYKTI